MKTVPPHIFTQDLSSSPILILAAKSLQGKCVAIHNLVSTLKFMFLIFAYKYNGFQQI